MCMGSDMAGREVKMLSIEDYFNNYKCGYEGCSCGEIVDGHLVTNFHCGMEMFGRRKEPWYRCSLTPTLCACLLGLVLISTGECEYYRVSHKIVYSWVFAILSGITQ